VTQIDTWTLIGWTALAAVAGFAAYVLIALSLARRFTLDTGSTIEALEIELPTVGHHIALFHHAPAEKKWAEPVILCHGLGANRFNVDFVDDGLGADRISLARALARAGFDVWVLELRGRGLARVPRGADWTVDDELREDVPTAIETVLDVTGQERVLWVGHSKGSLLQYLLHADRHPLASKVAALVAIGSPGTFRHQVRTVGRLTAIGAMFARLKRPIPLTVLAKLGVPIAEVIGLVGGAIASDGRWISGPVMRRLLASLAADIAPGVMQQFASWFANGGNITRRNGSSYEDDYRNITVPMLLIAGSRDLMAPKVAIDYLRERVASKDVTLRVMGTETGCKTEYGHGELVIGRHAPDEVFPLVIEWLEQRATPA
jgi:pimeloyl-ACP methyl ester carboxylesterase